MRRKSRSLVHFRLQFKVALIAFFVTCLALLVSFQLNMAGLWEVSATLPRRADATTVLEAIKSSMLQRFILAAVVSVPLSVAAGIACSFRFAGPIYHFRKYFAEMVTGRWDQHLNLRKGDDLKEVGSSINEALDQMRARLSSHQEIFAELETFFRQAGFAVDGSSQEQLTRIRSQMANERAAFEARFPTAIAGHIENASPGPVAAVAESTSVLAPTITS